ncbi:endonuclease/exonuclease/phosphatase family protein [Solimicrobium silvestre]|uniref:Metal-dependent hydrolase n=1 Tax=Solimicrobium silvestre TaxID=2099400 RepID=A0A2S9H0U2_9BURK|nr:endonuclease/exonuclease/phosphatase family protein [Solimicrobium silvestre]PRC93573.1 Metal-dependent hydrolase [Solimicrobium silvestre]
MKLHIATYNIHKGVSWFAQKPRIHDMRAALQSLDADLLFLQEVQGQHDRRAQRHEHWPSEGQHDYIAGDRRQAAYGMNATYQHGHHGNALLSRYPILHYKNQDVSDHRFEERGILHCVVQMLEKEVHCYVVHFGLFAAGRRRQTDLLIQSIHSGTPPDAPLIIAGDFNDWRNHLSEPLRQQLGVEEVFEHLSIQRIGRPKQAKAAMTFPVGAPFLPLDRIYVRGIQIKSAKVLQGSPWARLSDHAPLTADLEL